MAGGVAAVTPVITETIAGLVRPIALAREQVMPVISPLTTLLPHGLVRGTTVAVDGESGVTSLALALAAGPSQEGSWVAAVGVPWLGLGAAAECGVVLERLAVVSAPERSEWATVVAALVDAIDVVLVCPPQRVAMGDAAALAARARERGAVLLVVGADERVDGRRALHGHRLAVVGRRARSRASQVAASDGHRNGAGERGAPAHDVTLVTRSRRRDRDLRRSRRGDAARAGRGGIAAAVRTLVLCCPEWPVVAAGAVPDQPLAVVHANRVIASSPAARFEGVTPGLRRREAQGRCPGLDVVAADPARDARAFEPLAVALDVLTPRIEMTRPGTIAFATHGPSRYFGGDDA